MESISDLIVRGKKPVSCFGSWGIMSLGRAYASRSGGYEDTLSASFRVIEHDFTEFGDIRGHMSVLTWIEYT